MRYRNGLLFSIIFCLLATSLVAGMQKRAPSSGKSFDWEGGYSFTEVSRTSGQDIKNIIEHSLSVYRKNGELLADLSSDGYMTTIRMHCRVKITGNRLDLYLEKYGEDNRFELLEPGDHLLGLVYRAGRIYTYWDRLEAQMVRVRNGSVCFTKDK